MRVRHRAILSGALTASPTSSTRIRRQRHSAVNQARSVLKGGSTSAEHGIGALKVPWLALARTDAERALFARIRSALDRSGTLRPNVLPRLSGLGSLLGVVSQEVVDHAVEQGGELVQRVRGPVRQGGLHHAAGPDGQTTAIPLGHEPAGEITAAGAEVAALNEPMAVARHCVNRSQARPADKVVVTFDGG
jgi:hypothetical protein